MKDDEHRIAIGLAIGVATDDFALWISMGIANGAALGYRSTQEAERRGDD